LEIFINGVWVHQQRHRGFGGFWKLRRRVENGGEARDGVDIDTGDAESVDAGDSDADGAEVAEAGVEPGGEGLYGVDSDVVYISSVSESHWDADEEGADQHEGLLGGDGSSHEAQPSGRLASHYRVPQRERSLRCVSQPQCRGWLPGPGFARCLRFPRLVCLIVLS